MTGCWGPRHTLILMGFLGFASIYAMRVNLSLAIISMVNHTAIPHVNQTNSVDVCPLRSEDNHSTATASKVRQRENTGETITTIY